MNCLFTLYSKWKIYKIILRHFLLTEALLRLPSTTRNKLTLYCSYKNRWKCVLLNNKLIHNYFCFQGDYITFIHSSSQLPETWCMLYPTVRRSARINQKRMTLSIMHSHSCDGVSLYIWYTVWVCAHVCMHEVEGQTRRWDSYKNDLITREILCEKTETWAVYSYGVCLCHPTLYVWRNEKMSRV